MGEKSAAPAHAESGEMDCKKALDSGSEAEVVKALWAAIDMHETQGILPAKVGMGDIAKAAMGAGWGSEAKNLEGLCGDGISRTKFNLKLRLLSLLDKHVRAGEYSAEIFGAIFSGEIEFDLANVSVARGIIISAFSAGRFSLEAIEAAGNFICAEAVCPKDKETLLEMMVNAHRMGVDLSAAKPSLEKLSGEEMDGKRTKAGILAKTLVVGIESGGVASLSSVARSSWLPGGRHLKKTTPAKRVLGAREPTGKIKI